MIIWSLFDGSGIMGLPWAMAGHQVFCFNADSGNHGQYYIKMEHENIRYVNTWISDGWRPDDCGVPDMIFSFPDCTIMASSGKKHQRSKEEISMAVRLARVAENLASKFGCPWMVENPVGVLSTQWRKPDYYFDPYQFGGYLSGFESSYHSRMPSRDGYTKKTCIWCGNGMKWPDSKPVPHIGKFWGWSYLGGASAKTKQLRSLTPRGFARAVFEFNH